MERGLGSSPLATLVGPSRLGVGPASEAAYGTAYGAAPAGLASGPRPPLGWRLDQSRERLSETAAKRGEADGQAATTVFPAQAKSPGRPRISSTTWPGSKTGRTRNATSARETWRTSFYETLAAERYLCRYRRQRLPASSRRRLGPEHGW